VSVQYTIPGMHITEHLVTVPLNWSDPTDERTIELFAREVVDPARAKDDLPLLAFLQGGPGGKSPRPLPHDGWIAAALKTHRLILMDQRGTGRSSRVQSTTPARFRTTAEARDYLLCFRADSIVADLEFLRKNVFGGVRWQTLGQSYGGFVTLSYLSKAPEGLSACYVAGGLTSIQPSAADVYLHTYARLAAKNREYYRRFPGDAQRIGAVADRLAEEDIRLPDGDRLTVRRLQTLGLDFGMGNGLERVHWLFDDAFADGRLSDSFLHQVMATTSYDDNPLFAVMQESIYGSGFGATGWAAQQERAAHPELDPGRRPLLFTGEMMYPWMFEEIRSLRPFRAVVDALAEYPDYTTLYDADRLAANEVPVAAVAYLEDMFVDVAYCLETADLLDNCQLWVTNEYEHDGIRQHDKVVQRLLSMVADRGGALR
jgi:pimeloyl-ACP methyl ester carboxylesterase